ncbi:MAG: bifunctional 23S rRNA (guanine(2069)-N(7))-methyltransferase RlmK/23S rRNA (guanine(2445)-N(2))-methyltransferase RlmL [Pseudomonadota bacterium]|nr:bifunctional 23S rRNA (guanine(2069)-N(7))-methyltransferase RlmK/23S rRNA (guanine(2445)-N(2))-methyltransferase RlmL [Pseudomonadota bacterium]
MDPTFTFFATTVKGGEPLLADELAALGARDLRPGQGGVTFSSPLAVAYRACLWSRTASRVLLLLARAPAADAEALYAAVLDVPWEEHLSPDATLAVDFTGNHPAITHSRFGAQKVKDGIVDRLRGRFGRRPSVDRQAPDLRINCHSAAGTAALSVDLSGDSLHRRGYREATVRAPLKESLAAALLLKAGWPAVAAAAGPLLDPLCGSGTLPIEAAWIAADMAPGLLRRRWGFSGWLGHDAALWAELLAEAEDRRRRGLAGALPPILGFDHDPQAVRAAQENARRAGVGHWLRLERRELSRARPPAGPPGLVIANPPYGERLGDRQTLAALYEQLGDVLKARFGGWQAAVFTGNPELGKRMGLRAQRLHAFYNGALPCQLLRFAVEPEHFVDRAAADARSNAALLKAAEPFANRLRKNLRTLGAWARRENIHCYRLYDADLPEYNVAVDVYEQWVHVQEYAPPRSVDPEAARGRLAQIMAAVPAVLGVAREQVFSKTRQRQPGIRQYEKQAEGGDFHEVREGPGRFLVNFSDYLDTGLFLDHRLTRQLLGNLAQGRRFLNLFGYTGTATVCAALGGATSTTTVDLSRTYLDWTARNLALNGIAGPQHSLVQADCLAWLKAARERYGLIFLDPPTFSTSKRMADTFDVQRDHPELIRQAAGLLAADGVLIFSTPCQRFRLDREALADLTVEDISRQTIPRDFARRPRIHSCFRISR